uniref:Uncharacterized protein n=1 Tax=Palpitomonas bilix TaxID=652834 RepID=A0A7S3DG17_9EUKA|mmetsp:Transcript_36097/g.93879  ORF Transcript_36097/g.93879 Transcript_36097/m.93879 type:complete len:243 (+) Transcript_36097:135-863(+)
MKGILLLCGLPGAGKSTAGLHADDVIKSVGAESKLISFDGIESQIKREQLKDPAVFDVQVWNEARRIAKEQVRSCCNANHAQDLVLIVDDNMHYRSMRREYYRLARDYGCPFLLIYVHSDPEVAWERNSARVEGRIPSDTFWRMVSLFEEPSAEEMPENHIVVFENEDGLDYSCLDSAICRLLESPLDFIPAPAFDADGEALRQVIRLFRIMLTSHLFHPCSLLSLCFLPISLFFPIFLCAE